MAGSRYHKLGTIFSRTSGLLKSGAIKPEDKPLWYDVYEAFPPKVEPKYDRPQPTVPIKSILYPEDIIRAKFYRKYGNVGIINLSEENSRQTICQLFIQEYKKLEVETTLNEDEMWTHAVANLESRGIRVEKKEFEETKTEREPEAKELNLSQLFSEEAKKMAD